MICEKCGENLIDGICPNCGKDENQIEKKAGVENSSKKSKKYVKKIFLATFGGIATLCLVGLIVFFVVNLDKIKLDKVRKNGTGQEYLGKILESNIEKSFKKSKFDLGTLEEKLKLQYHYKANYKFDLSEEMLQWTGVLSNDSDFSFLNNVEIKQEAFFKDFVIAQDYSLSLDDIKLISLDYIFDVFAYNIFFSVPEISKKTINLNFIEEMNSADYEPVFRAVLSSLPSNSSIEKVLVNYSKLFFENLGEISKTEEKLIIEGISETQTVLNFEITKKTLDLALKEILIELKKDENIKLIVEDFQEVTNETGIFMESLNGTKQEIPNLYEEFLVSLDKSLDSVNSRLKEKIYDETPVFGKIYVDYNHNITGFSLFASGESEFFVDVKTVEDENKFATKIQIDTITFQGRGSVEDNLKAATYKVKESGKTLCSVGYENLDVKALKKNQIEGKFFFNLEGNYNNSAGGMAWFLLAFSPTIEVDLSMNNKNVDYVANFKLGAMDLIKVFGNAEIFTEDFTIDFPTENLLTIEDVDNGEYVNSLSLLGLVENIEKTSLPNLLKDVLRDLAYSIEEEKKYVEADKKRDNNSKKHF